MPLPLQNENVRVRQWYVQCGIGYIMLDIRNRYYNIIVILLGNDVL